MKILSIIGLLIAATIAQANISPTGFEAYSNYYFVETGTYGGNGIRYALRAGFKEIHSIDIDNKFVEQALKTFRNNSNVHLWSGNSGEVLWDIIKYLDKPITFWLDAHRYPPHTEGKNCPLMEELEHIKRHSIKTHTILIDDMMCAGTLAFDNITKEQLKEKILEINPNYVVTFIPGGDQGEYPVNVMLACVQD